MRITLDKLPINNTGKIFSINTDDEFRKRLLDLGFVKGTNITSLYKSPFNDPKCYLIKGGFIALRNKDSKNIIIDMESDYNGAY